MKNKTLREVIKIFVAKFRVTVLHSILIADSTLKKDNKTSYEYYNRKKLYLIIKTSLN